MKIAILGFGIVGSGTYEVLANGNSGVEVKRILDIKKVDAVADKLTTNFDDIINDISKLAGVRKCMILSRE